MPYPGADTFPDGSLADLATVADLSTFAQLSLEPADATAALLLKVASGMVRTYLQQDLVRVDDDVEVLDPVGGLVELPNLPVVSVSLVEITNDGGATWIAVDPTSYTVSRRLGLINARPYSGVCWPSDPESWRVTYTHGFETIPPEITGVVCGVAARAYSSPIGIDMERTGQRQVKYAVESQGFSALEQAVLDKYRIGRVA